MGRSAQLRPNKAKIGEQQAVCLQLRLEGQSYRAIAATTGLSLSTVYERVETAVAAEVNPRADELRAIECERLDHYLARLAPKIADGDDRAINTAVRISERRSKMLGLDMPTRVEANVQTHEVTQQDLELQEMIRAAKAKNAVIEAEIRAEQAANREGQ